jgi:ADP-ribose pyrophosphatase
MKRPLTILCSRSVFSGHVFNVASLRVRTRDNRLAGRDLVVHGGSCAAVPFVDVAHVLLIRQYRFATGRWIWEIPAGTLEPGERPLACIRRELEEETGFTAKRFKRVSRFYTCPGFCSEVLFLYFAYDLEKGSARRDDDGEDIAVCRSFSLKQAVRMVHRGQIVDGKTIIGIMLAAER